MFGRTMGSLRLGMLRRTVAFAKALAGEGCSGCWEKLLPASFGLYRLLCKARAPLATPDSEGTIRRKEMKIF